MLKNYFGIEKDAHGHFSKDAQIFQSRGPYTGRLFADLIILIKKRLVPAVYLDLGHRVSFIYNF